MIDIEAIKNDLRAASSLDEVARAADKHRAAVVALHADPAQKAMYLQVINLKAYRINSIKAGHP